MDELKEYLLDQGVWKREIDEVLFSFDETITKKDLNIAAIFDSAYDLADSYIDNNVNGELDHCIAAVLNYTELGEYIAENGDEYLLLSSGRILKFEL